MQRFILIYSLFLIAACSSGPSTPKVYNNTDELNTIVDRMKWCVKEIEVDSIKIPRSLNEDRTLIADNSRQWTSGFFPGTLWQLASYSKDSTLYHYAAQWTAFIEKEKFDDHTHDLGFKVNNSFGKGYQFTIDTSYRNIIVQAAKTLINRYNPNVGAIRSWDWGKDKWEFPVIIDNMMNLEMLFDATIYTGDSVYYDIARQHALTTLDNHFRSDNSSYHVIDYYPETGKVRNRHTHQGLSHESAWSRGQAWGLYGFTKAYHYTKDARFLDQAKKIAMFIFNHPNLPEDLIPYWDYDAPDIPNEPRDVSAATVTASALFDLAQFDKDHAAIHRERAKKILQSLSMNDYKAEECPFLLDHSVGSVPGKFEVDVPIIYADYYYVEALLKNQNQ